MDAAVAAQTTSARPDRKAGRCRQQRTGQMWALEGPSYGPARDTLQVPASTREAIHGQKETLNTSARCR